MSKAQELDLIWKHTHPDYRGKIDGVRYVLVWSNAHGTSSIPLQSLHAKEHAEKLAYAMRCEERGKRGW